MNVVKKIVQSNDARLNTVPHRVTNVERIPAKREEDEEGDKREK